jgi:polysaccharide biosynthesis transport protein
MASQSAAANVIPTEPGGQVSLSALQHLVWQRRWYVLAATLLAVALGALFLAVAPPRYEIQARLLVEQQGMPLEQVSADPRGNKEFLATQAEVIRSPAVVQRAVEKHGLTVSTAPNVDPATAILEELLVAPVLGTNVLSVQYASINPDQAQQTVSAIIDSYRGYLREHEADSQLEAIRLLTRSEKELRDDLARREQEYLKLREQSPLLGGQGRDAVVVQLGQLTHLGETIQTIVSRRLELTNLLEAMQEANEVAETGPANDLQLVALRSDSSQESRGVPVTSANLRPEGLIPRFTQDRALPRDLVTIQDELSRARSQLQQLSSQYGPRHPAVQTAKAQALAWRDRLNEYLKSAPGTLKQELTALSRQERQLQDLYEAELTKAKSVDSYLIREQQALDGITRVQTMHSSLLAQLQQWQLTEHALADGRSRVTFRVLEEPVAPDKPSWPAPKLVLAVSVILGLGSGLGLALFLGPKPAPQLNK